MSKVFVITSGKGGVGKTTSAINLGAGINSLGGDVIIVDANLTTPNIGLHLGAPIVPIALNHVLNNKAKLSEAIYEHESGTKILPSSLSIKELKKIKPEKVSSITKRLKKIADYIILDSAAGLGSEAIGAIQAADELILVTNPEMPAVTDALKTIKIAEELNKDIKGIIINRVKRARTEMPIKNIRDMLETPILGIIPEDKKIQKALVKRDAVMHVYPRAKSSKAFLNISGKLMGKRNNNNTESFWQRIKYNLGF